MNPSQLHSRLRLAYHRRRSPIWFISFPKSGRTWTKTIVENYLSRNFGLPPITLDEAAPWIRWGAARNIPRVTFIHPHCTSNDPAVTDRFMDGIARKKVVVLVRDPRDVVFTYYFRLRKRIKDPQVMSMPLDEFVRHPSYGITRIVDFTNTWFAAQPRFKDFLFLRFEDIQRDPEKEIVRLLKFLSIGVNVAVLREVLASTEDQTTRAVEDDTAVLSDVDSAFIEDVALKLNPEIGYQVGPHEAD